MSRTWHSSVATGLWQTPLGPDQTAIARVFLDASFEVGDDVSFGRQKIRRIPPI
jgi:hypothetical protein